MKWIVEGGDVQTSTIRVIAVDAENKDEAVENAK